MKYNEKDNLGESFKCGLCGSAVYEYLANTEIKDIFGSEDNIDDYFHACENEYCLNSFGVYDYESEYIEESEPQGVLGLEIQSLLTKLKGFDEDFDEDAYADYKAKKSNYDKLHRQHSLYISSKNSEGAVKTVGVMMEANKEYLEAKKKVSKFEENIENREKVIKAIVLLRSI